MTRYAVGDLQGCLTPLQCLLEEVSFKPASDQLWLVGDLINRGPDSLGTLRFVKQLGDCTRIVLGNHDLHFLAVAYGVKSAGKMDTFDEILNAPDREELVDFLRHQALIYRDDSYSMVHAGIPPIWDLEQATNYAAEVETVLRSDGAEDFLANMYGNHPLLWDENLTGLTRLRVITNYLTRMRFCKADGSLDLDNKQALSERGDFAPWFSYSNRRSHPEKIIFGHWASLEGRVNTDNIYALDTGCVWGRSMTLFNLDNQKLHSCSCTP